MTRYEIWRIAKNIELRCTCGASPEQYDAFLDDKQVGYIRLRWGFLSVRYPDNEGEAVLTFQFDDGWKGGFDSEESEYWLQQCKMAIATRIYDEYNEHKGDE